MATRPTLPQGPLSVLTAAVDRDGIYVRSATPDFFALNKAELKLRGGRAGIITDMSPDFRAMVLRDVLIKVGKGDKSTTLWGVRRHRLVNPVTERVRVVDMTRPGAPTNMREHAIYDEIASGVAVYRDCSGLNVPAQLLQIRLANNRADIKWKNERDIRILNLHGEEIGQERGAGRAAFALSVKDQGPNADVLVSGLFLRTVKQKDVAKKSDGTWADSFGGVCIEYCRSLVIDDAYIAYKNPKLDAIQLFNYADKSTTRTGPEDILITNTHIDLAGNISLRIDASLRKVRIAGCSGNGKIKIYKRDAAGIWRVTQNVPISQGYSYTA